MSINERVRPWIARSTAGIVVLAAASAVGVGLTAAPAAASCPVEWGNGTDTTQVKFSDAYVNLRYEPNTTSCINGRITTGHVLQYKCWWRGTTVNGWSSWTYLQDKTNGNWGWASDALLPNNGSGVHCNSVSGLG
jgi:hypothetical protein